MSSSEVSSNWSVVWLSDVTYCVITESSVLPTQLQSGFETSPAKEPHWANRVWAWNIHSLKNISILGRWGSNETCQCPILVLCPSFKKSCHLDYKRMLQIHYFMLWTVQWGVYSPSGSATQTPARANGWLSLPSWQIVFVSSTIILFIYLVSAVKSGQRLYTQLQVRYRNGLTLNRLMTPTV